MSTSDMDASDDMSDSSWDDNDACDIADVADNSRMSTALQCRYVALEPADIVSEQRVAIDRVMEITGFPSHMARTFLQQMKWNFEKLAEFYYEDPERALSKVGLATNTETACLPMSVDAAAGAEDGSVRCEICFDDVETQDVPTQMTVVPGCGHHFCNECWRRHLSVQIDDGHAPRIHCAGTTKSLPCNIILDDSLVQRLLSDGGAALQSPLAAYRRRLMESYVNDNPHVKWCPGTDCCHAVRITDGFDARSSTTQVECAAGHTWCFLCSGEAHSPAACDAVKAWKQKCADDSETCNWMQANTKDCPKCQVAINKDGGCNHMHCKQCNHHFCWICLGDFDHASYKHTCNTFVSKDEAVSQSRAALERYMHHFTRFQTHAKSREVEAELQEKTVEKMTEMQDSGNKTFLEVQFLKEAAAQLMEARRVLQWSYVVAFSSPDWLQKNIFQSNQSELENATEELSFTFENTAVLELCSDAGRVKVIDQTKKVQRRLHSMIANLDDMRADAL